MSAKSSKDDSRSLILQAAFDAFAEKGYDGTSMDDIVQRSGLSKGTLYWHFTNKHDLFVATLNWAMKGLDESFIATLQQVDRPVADRLLEMFVLATRYFISDPRWTRLIASAFFLSAQSDVARQTLLEMYKQYITVIETGLQQGIERGEFLPMDTHKTAIALMAGGDGIAFHSLLNPPWEIIPIMETFIHAVLKGFLKESPGDDTNAQPGTDV
jgi:AcrR family transcriptional regulator